MSCNCNPFKRMIEANFAKAEAQRKKARKPDAEREYEKKLLEEYKEKEKNG